MALAFMPPPNAAPPFHALAAPNAACSHIQQKVAIPNRACHVVMCAAPWMCLFQYMQLVPMVMAGSAMPRRTRWWTPSRAARIPAGGVGGCTGMMPSTKAVMASAFSGGCGANQPSARTLAVRTSAQVSGRKSARPICTVVRQQLC